MRELITKYKDILIPALVFVCIILGFFFGSLWYILAIVLGSFNLIVESVRRIIRRDWSLDYLAVATIVTAVITRHYSTGAIIALMVCISDYLETYGTATAEKTLAGLVSQLPTECTVVSDDDVHTSKLITDILLGEHILIRNQEIIPLDGTILSDIATINEANLTGEAIPVTYKKGYSIKSGMINTGSTIIIETTGDFTTSTYQGIIALAQESKKTPPRFVRLARKYNFSFTIGTAITAFIAWIIFKDIDRVLSILAIATPCPLLIAAPLSYLGGINRAAKGRIVVKKPGIFETLTHVDTVFFDKTGTLTLGEPVLRSVIPTTPIFREDELLAKAVALEIHSLHPLARALITEAEKRNLKPVVAHTVTEKIGEGISGTIEGKKYSIKKSTRQSASGIILDFTKDDSLIGQFLFDDILKDDVDELFAFFKKRGVTCAVLTGDTASNAERVFSMFDIPLYSDCSPEKKLEIVTSSQKQGHTVAVIGDGVNDAPALAVADAGIIFSGTHNTGALDSADVALFSHSVLDICSLFVISSTCVSVAKQSVLFGIGASSIGIAFAFFGFVSPAPAALIQEIIDVTVILNSLRSTY